MSHICCLGDEDKEDNVQNYLRYLLELTQSYVKYSNNTDRSATPLIE
jgi:hypothetical protein